VTVGGQTVAVTAVGFQAPRVLRAPQHLRPEDRQRALPAARAARRRRPGGHGHEPGRDDLAGPPTIFTLTADPLRYSPAIHVNQEGYVPSFPKKAMVGYYLGDMGEMPVTATGFSIIDVNTNAVVFQGSLTLRQDVGYETTPLPYQQVYVADFSSFTTPGEYQLQVAGMGASLPFLINDGIAMAWVRTYALGMYEQRSGTAVGLPYTRFAHAADHTAPASVPARTQPRVRLHLVLHQRATRAGHPDSPNAVPADGPALTSNENSLYPFVNTGTVDVSGGHWDAGDYSKYTENSAQLIHELIFAWTTSPGSRPWTTSASRERRRHSRRPPGGQVGGRLPGQDAGRRRRLLLPGLPDRRGVRERPAPERRGAGRLAQEHLGHRRRGRRPWPRRDPRRP
jgi:hypothetical protein